MKTTYNLDSLIRIVLNTECINNHYQFRITYFIDENAGVYSHETINNNAELFIKDNMVYSKPSVILTFSDSIFYKKIFDTDAEAELFYAKYQPYIKNKLTS